MAKAKTGKVQTTVDSPTVNAVVDDFNTNGAAKAAAPDYQLIHLDQLVPSKTNPRKRFPEVSIAELAGSIREKGILEPLIVRSWAMTPVETKKGTDYEKTFEIVCGERRYRAAVVAGLAEAPCMVRVLTDAEVLDIQIHENLHREDVHPIDEAYGYKFLQESQGYDVAEIVARVGKSPSYVSSRLELNKLTADWQKELEEDRVSLTVALAIAKYPAEVQTRLFEDNDIHWEMYADGDRDLPMIWKAKDIDEWAAQEVYHNLEKAHFSTTATNLREDGLACVNCPDRTGAKALLFDPKIAKNDSCLNPSCYKAKTDTLIQITRIKIAAEADIKPDAVPRVYPGCFHRMDHIDLTDHEYKKVLKKDKKCTSTIYAVSVAKESFNKTLRICLSDSGCDLHWPKGKTSQPSKSSSSASSYSSAPREKSQAEKDQFYERKEEIWNCKVAEETRKRVFAIAAGEFAKTFSVSGGGDRFVSSLCAKLWELYSSDHIKRRIKDNIARPILASHMQVEPNKLDFSNEWKDNTASERKIAAISDDNQKRLLFLLLNGHKGDVSMQNWVSQSGVTDIAAEWKIDYALIDAKVRVELSTKKHLQLHQDYLLKIENGKSAPRPWIFSDKWNPKD